MDTTEQLEEEMLDITFPEPPAPAPVRRGSVRAEWVMGGIAVLCGVLAAVALLFSLPHMAASEDPEAVLDRAHPPEIHETEGFLEPTVEETQPVNPTVPPERNPYDRFDFQYTRHNYLLLQNLPSRPGVDVSAYQGDIDWKRVKYSGIQFAMIRLGYRGYGSGKLVEDEFAEKNLDGAAAAGLDVGAYFFSQALTVQEVDEEIAFLLKTLGDRKLTMPIILDWEIPAENARTVNMDARTLTDLQLHFAKVMSEKGYDPMIYFNWHQSEKLYFLSELEDYPFWLALYQDRMTYPWKVEMWQYTDKGRVPGINGPVDVNVYMPDA